MICIVGPTAVGKTKLSLALAKAFNGEIISGDAFQFYQGMDIGTAKASQEEQAMVKHHLLDILSPEAAFSVVEYQGLVRDKIKEIQAKGKLPIIVGGSGLYIQSIIKDYRFKGQKRQDNQPYASKSLEDLQALLKEKNPKFYELVDLSNKRRLIRALEKHDDDIQRDPKDYYDDVCLLGLYAERDDLYKRINQRVLDMVEKGLLEEAKVLYDKGIHTQATKAIGYKELFPYFSGQYTLDRAIELIQRNSRRYAKRQMTWFRNKMDVTWFQSHLDHFQETIDAVIQTIKKTHQR